MVSSTSLTLVAVASTAVTALSFQSHGQHHGGSLLRARAGNHIAARAASVASGSNRMVRKQKRAPRVTYQSTANFYAQTGGYSACHTYFGDNDLVIALPTGLWQDVTQVSPLCGQKVVATNPADGTSVTLTVQDASWSSTYATLPRGAYLALGGKETDGVLPIEFYFQDSKALDASLLPTNTASATDVSWAPSTDKANHAEASETNEGKVAEATSVKVEEEAQATTTPAPASSAAAEETTSVREASVNSKVAAVKITSSTAPATPTTPAFDSVSAARASSAAAAQRSADAQAAAERKKQEEQAAAAAQAEADKKAQEAEAAAAAEAAKQKAEEEKAQAEAAAAASKAAAEATKTPEPKPEPAPSPAPAPPAQGNVHSGGQATWFQQNGNPGHCGQYNSDSTKLVALPSAIYDNGSHCGKTVRITRVDTGKTVDAIVADSCPTCPNSNGDLDLSVGAFNSLGSPGEGVFPITWQYI